MPIDENLEMEGSLESKDRFVKVDGHQERRAQWAYAPPQPQPPASSIGRFLVLALILAALVVGAYLYKRSGGYLP